MTPPSSRAEAKPAERSAFLQAIASASPQESLLARVARRGADGLSIADAAAETGWLPARVEQLAAELAKSGQMVRFEDRLLSPAILQSLRGPTSAKVEQFHKTNPLVAGISQEQLRETVGLGPEIFRGVLDSLVREKKWRSVASLFRLRARAWCCATKKPNPKSQIEQAFAKAGLKVPLLKDVLASLPVDKVRAQKIVTLLLRDRVLVKLSDDLVFHRDALESLRRQIVVQKTKTPKLNVGNFKDLFGITRKYAIPLLEYLDRERVTRRIGDERVIL